MKGLRGDLSLIFELFYVLLLKKLNDILSCKIHFNNITTPLFFQNHHKQVNQNPLLVSLSGR